jgi:hypothetical protein
VQAVLPVQTAATRMTQGTGVVRRRVLTTAALVAIAVVTYHRAFSAYYLDDDFQWLVGTMSFTASRLFAIGHMSHFYRPVIEIYFAVATPLFGGSPVLFHGANIALHLGTALVLFALAERISGSALYAGSASLFFVVQPAGVEAVAWVGALAETIGALFGCLTVLWFLRWRDSARGRWRRLSCAAFVLALLTHESSVVFLTVIVLADWAFVSGRRDAGGRLWPRAAGWVRAYAPFLAIVAAYLAVDLYINSQNYLVREGHFALGWHVVRNAGDYLVALAVGRHEALNYALVAVTVGALLLRGTRRVRFAAAWMLLALAPFVPFTWGTTSRYMYQPAIGFSLLLGEAVVFVDCLLARRVRAGVRAALVGVVVAAVALRFAVFAMHNIESFASRAETYRQQAQSIQGLCGTLPRGTMIAAPAQVQEMTGHGFGNALLQWVCRDPTVGFTPY